MYRSVAACRLVFARSTLPQLSTFRARDSRPATAIKSSYPSASGSDGCRAHQTLPKRHVSSFVLTVPLYDMSFGASAHYRVNKAQHWLLLLFDMSHHWCSIYFLWAGMTYYPAVCMLEIYMASILRFFSMGVDGALRPAYK